MNQLFLDQLKSDTKLGHLYLHHTFRCLPTKRIQIESFVITRISVECSLILKVQYICQNSCILELHAVVRLSDEYLSFFKIFFNFDHMSDSDI